MPGDNIEKDLRNVADAISLFINNALSEEGQNQAISKLSHLFNVASQLIDHLDFDQESVETEQNKKDIINGKSLLQTFYLILNTALTNPESLAKHYAQFATHVLQVLSLKTDIRPAAEDRRFKDNMWQDSSFLNILMQIYLAWDEHIHNWLRDQALSPADEQRVMFILNQFICALSPTNLPINPSALKFAEKTDGKSAVKGLLNWVSDICFNQSMPKQINNNAYVIGVDLAATPGQVIFRNEQLELIQYQPQTSLVHRRPVLLIPPQINKYYIFDLKTKNSMLNHLVNQELQMFVISWRNPNKSEAHWGLDVYITALLEAIEVVRAVTKSRTIGLISACAGGLTTAAMLGYLAETNNPIVRHQSSLVTTLAPTNDSVLELFTTRKTIKLARAHSKIEGVMDGKALSRVFTWLRPEDLIWKYWVNNYLMGRDPPPLDVLYWDNDSTRLPASLHSDFLDMYEHNVFMHPHRHKVLGIPINYRKAHVNTYVVAGREDYLMPWKSVYRTTQIFRGKHRFVLSTSGHVQSILRPPNLAQIEYFTNERIHSSADDWYNTSQQQDGTWWHDWIAWLQHNSGSKKRAPEQLGNNQYPPIISAPGTYVHEKI